MKQNRKQMKASIINEVAEKYRKSYEDEITKLSEKLKDACDKNYNLQNKLFELTNRNDELEQKVYQYEDWIVRLQEWCNLPDEEREQAIKQYKVQQESSKKLNGLMDMFQPYMNLFF